MSEFSTVLASISCGLASCCVVLSLWSFVRLSRLEAKTNDLDDKLPPKRVREMEGAFDALNSAFDAHVQKNAEWKQSVHNSVQRMDQIMRRNEQATNAQLLDGDGNFEESPDVVKGELPPETAAVAVDHVKLGKQAALRLRYNQNRGIQ